MSKLGKKPIEIPKDTKVKVENGKLILTGPKGSKELSINDKIYTAAVADDKNLSLKLQNRLLGEGVIECKDISHSGLNFQDEYKNDEVINTILNEIKDAICDFGGETLEGFENINKEIFNKLSLNEHCIYILIILVIILIF